MYTAHACSAIRYYIYHWTQPSVECYAAAFVIVTEDYLILWEMLELAEVVDFAAGAAAAVAVAFFLPLEAVLLTEDLTILDETGHPAGEVPDWVGVGAEVEQVLQGIPVSEAL